MEAGAGLPVFDVAPFLSGGGWPAGAEATGAQQAAARALDAACRGPGFVALAGHGLDARLADALAEAKALFALDDAGKAALRPIDPKSNFGFAPYATETLNQSRPADLKEAFNVRCPRVHDNDFAGTPHGFGPAALALWHAVEEVALALCSAVELALGVERGFFARHLERMDLCTVRFLHYPPCDFDAGSAEGAAGKAIRVGEHTDFGLFTMLFLDGRAEGLQVKRAPHGSEVGGEHGGEHGGWTDIVGTADGAVTAVVNTGALLARWTNDTWCATAHRVVVNDPAVAARDRYSIACFIDPDATAPVVVHPKFVPAGEAPRYGPTTGLGYLMMKLREAQGVADEEGTGA